jgi:hypothetical protein
MHDFTLHGGPEEFLLYPVSDDANDWMKLRTQSDAKFLGKGVVIRRGCLDDILKGIDSDGLTVLDNRKLLG